MKIANTNSNLKPNATCRNSKCPHGINGKPKKYYVCRYCDRVVSWLSVGCCEECANEYSAEIRLSRGITIQEEIVENRTDMNLQQLDELLSKPIEKVKDEVIKEITDAGYGENLEDMGLIKTLKKINEDIDKSEPIEINEMILDEVNDKPYETKRSRRSKYNQ